MEFMRNMRNQKKIPMYLRVKAIILTIVALLFSSVLQAQELRQAEYFFDTDPGIGNGMDISITAGASVDLNVSVSIVGLSPGFHRVFVRVEDSNNTWSQYEGRTFYIDSTYHDISSCQVTGAEYFFDADPGIGNGMAFIFTADDTVTVMQSVTLTGLSSGFHRIFARYQDNNDQWSLYEGRTFYIDTTAQQIASEIVALEFFVGADPGIGNGSPITIEAGATLDSIYEYIATGLEVGNHAIVVRAKDNLGHWSISESRQFEVVNCTYAVPNFELSLACTDSIVLINDLSTGVDVNSIYSWDLNDDGLADYTTNGDITHTFTAGGLHTISLQITNEGGCISSIEKEIEIFSTPEPTINSSCGTELCEGETLTLATETGMSGYTWSTLEDVESIVVSSSGSYSVSVVDGNGCEAISEEISITVNPIPELFLGNDTVLCETETLQLQVPSFFSYLWNDDSDLANYLVSESGQYWLEVVDNNNCSDRDTINVSYNLIDTTKISEAICQNDVFDFYERELTEAGLYYHNLRSSLRCDSVIELNLIVNPVYNIFEEASICAGETYSWQGSEYSQSGTYNVEYVSGSGCDSLFELSLSVYDLPALDLGDDLSISTEDTLILDAGNDCISYLWNTEGTTQTINVYGSVLGLGEFDFSVWVSDDNACQNVDTILISIEQGYRSSDPSVVNVFPNPVKDILYIEYEIAIKSIEFYSIKGQLLFIKDDINLNVLPIVLKGLEQGIYILSITDAQDEIHRVTIFKE
jgi:hypothetical protein